MYKVNYTDGIILEVNESYLSDFEIRDMFENKNEAKRALVDYWETSIQHAKLMLDSAKAIKP